MVIANVVINVSSAKTVSCEPLPIGGSGLQVEFRFHDPIWNQLSKTAVFRNRSKTLNAALVDNRATIPYELLTNVADVLYVGIYGTDSSNCLIIPTVWAKLGEISAAANPSADYSEAMPSPYWAQLKESVEKLQNSLVNRDEMESAFEEFKESDAFANLQGQQGEKGDDGYSPVIGVDYWTDEDQEYIIGQTSKLVAYSLRHTYDIQVDLSGTGFALADASDRELKQLRIFGKSTPSKTPSLQDPAVLKSIGDNGSVTVTICGKNLCPGMKPGGYLGASGIYEAGIASSYSCTELIPVCAGVEYVSSNNLNTGISDIHVYAADGTWVGRLSKDQMNNRPENAAFMAFNFYKPNGLSWVQVEIGSVATEYVPYESQTLTFPTPNGLAGIPVTSGGNYTDRDGNQWVCDEVDFANCRFIQRIGRIASYNGEPVDGIYLSSTGALSHGATVLYVLPDSVETVLSLSQLNDFASMHTCVPSSTIHANGTYLNIKYVADTKGYIDHKFAQLASAIVNNA